MAEMDQRLSNQSSADIETQIATPSSATASLPALRVLRDVRKFRITDAMRRLAVPSIWSEQHPVLATALGIGLVACFVPILIHANAMNGDFSQSVALIFLVPVLLASTLGGWLSGVTVCVVAECCWNWFFTRPFRTIGFVSLEDFLAQAVFLVVALLVGQLSTLLRRRAGEALRRNAELAAVLDVTQSVGSTLDLVPLLGLILDQVRTVIEYNSAAIALRDGDEVTIVDYRGDSAFTEVTTQTWDVSRATLYQEVARRGRPIIVDDVWSGERAATAIRNSPIPVDSGAKGARAWLVVPLTLKGSTFGFISFSHELTGFYALRARHASPHVCKPSRRSYRECATVRTGPGGGRASRTQSPRQRVA